MTLREKVAQAIDDAMDKFRRNRVFKVKVSDPRLLDVWHTEDGLSKVYVLTQDDYLPQSCNPMAYLGAWIYKAHWKANREAYLDSIMKCFEV